MKFFNLKKKKKKQEDELPEVLKMNEEELIEFKKSAWEESVDHYAENVETVFFNSVIKEIFLKYIKPGFKVFDMGAGTGRLSFALAENGCEVLANDTSEKMLNYINQHKGDRNITTMVADGEKINEYSNQFDAVTSLSFMSHFPNWHEFLKIKSKLCKPGGYILFNFRSKENFNTISENESEVFRVLFKKHFMASSEKDAFEKICSELNLEVINKYPIHFFNDNALFYPYLSIDEIKTFNELFAKLLMNPKILDIMTFFEKNIIQKMDNNVCSDMIVVLKKKETNSEI